MMSTDPTSIRPTTYPAARSVAPSIQAHFSQQLEAARLRGENYLAGPTAPMVEALLEAAFWASLRREEGYSPKISLAFLPPEQAGQPLLFKHTIPLSPQALVKLSPGVERSGIHLGIWYQQQELYIWGTTLTTPAYCMVLDVSEPGLIVIKHRRQQGFGKFRNVAVLIGDQIKVVDEDSARQPDCPGLLKSLINFNSNSTAAAHGLIQLAVSMRAHGHGGSLLVVPAGSHNWQNSIVQPIKYRVDPGYSGLASLMQDTEAARSGDQKWQASLQAEISSLAGLTAIDGATIISDAYELLAFGAKIGRGAGSTPIERLFITEPIRGGTATHIHPSQVGGTRHLSAAQFVQDQPDALALVASQDGQFTIFSWSPCEGMVQAHRIETLLL